MIPEGPPNEISSGKKSQGRLPFMHEVRPVPSPHSQNPHPCLLALSVTFSFKDAWRTLGKWQRSCQAEELAWILVEDCYF